MSSTTYLSELVPKSSRGRVFAFNQLLSFSAIPVVALLSLFLVPRSFLGIDGWRWVTVIGSTGAFLVFIARRNLPESPRWLEQTGRHQEADQIMTKIEARVQRETGRRLAEPRMVEDSLPGVASQSFRRRGEVGTTEYEHEKLSEV